MQSVLFRNRIEAANELAKRLKLLKEVQLENKVKRNESDIIVVAIPRGGIILGDIIAIELRTKLDLVVSRKIGAPFNPELAIGAVMPDGSYFLNDVAEMINVSQDYIESQIRKEVKEIDRRLIEFRGSRNYDNKLEDKIVVLVDDGIATGATILASAKWIKDKHNCRQLIIAVPLAPREILEDLNRAADKVIVLYTPEPFGAVGRFYQDFNQVSDDEVKEIMKKYLPVYS
ncbi:MAG: phosphoribosyltransferase [Thermoproteota archaeon]|jgi:putative phosphoribosyl transferase|nr:phosphoribosyltransferase [Thermoproteota archaeon]